MAESNLKLFVSSPGDLLPEREAVQRVVARINGDYLGVVHFEVIRWEEKSYSARAGFQSQIVEASSCELVIAMLYQRMGTPLPVEVAQRADGSAFESGTAYEIETSLLHAQTQGTPQLYMFRKAASALLAPEERAQFEVLERFWQRLFVDCSGRILRAFQSFQSISDLQPQLDLCVRGWLAEQGYLRDAPAWNSAVLGSPFRGLAAFEEQHAAVYFGRRVALDLAWQRLLRAHEQGAGFLLMLGASGSGKSSLVKAGVVPQFRVHFNAHGVILAHVAQLRPGNDPLAALARALRELAQSPSAELDALADLTPKYLLVIDQFEELFDQSDTDIAEFATQCLALVQTRGFFIVATMRADCYASLLEHSELSQLKDAGLSFDVRAPSDVDIEEMLRGPAAAAKLEFERAADGSDLADLILADLAGSDALAMMQLTLEELFQGRRDSTLTFARYRQLGGVQGALLSAAESAYESLDASAQAALPQLLSELVAGFSDSGEAMCRPVPLPDVGVKTTATQISDHNTGGDDAQARGLARARLIAALVQKRLLIVDGAHVRVAHEALVRAWPRAVQVLEEISAAVRLRERLAAPLSEWQRDSDALLPAGALLFNALELVDGKLATLLSPAERDFILLSKDADRRQRTRRTRRLSLIAIAMSVLALIAGVMAWNAKLASDKAQLSFSASVTAVNALTRDLAQNLRQSRGVRAETVASVLSKAQVLVASIEKTDPGNVDLEYARIGMLLGFSETYRSVARSKEANAALDAAMARLRKLAILDNAQPGAKALAQLRIEANLALSQRAYFELDLDDAERYARAAFDAPAFAEFGINPALRMNAKLKLAKTLFFQNKLKQVSEIEVVDALPQDISHLSGDELADALDYYVAIASAKNELGQTESAKLLRSQASALLELALKQAPNSAQLLQTRMSLRRAEANILANVHEAQALALLNQEIALGREAINGNPNSATLRLAMKSLLNTRSQLYRKAGDHVAELADLRSVVTMLSELSEQDLGNLFLRAEVSFAGRRLANVLLAQNAQASSPFIGEAESATLAALEIDRELFALAPKRAFARRYLAATLEQLGDLRKRQANYSDALSANQESLTIRLGLARDYPQEFAWYRLCGLSYSAIKDVYVRQNDAINALAAQAQASTAFAKVLELGPSPSARFEWFDSMLFEAELMRDMGKHKELAAQLLRLTQFAQAHSDEFKTRPDLLAILAELEATHRRDVGT